MRIKINRIKRELPVALRNTAVFIMLVLVVLKGFDMYLSVNSKVSDSAAAEFADEESRIIKMNVEKADINDYACAATSRTTTEHIKKLNEDIEIIPSPYPLIRDMADETLYDENTKNIVIIGDSFVWGQGSINRNELFWGLAEEQLRSEGYNVRFYSVSMAGANAYEEIKWLTETSLTEDLSADMVIFGYMYNDAVPLTDDYIEIVDNVWDIAPSLKGFSGIFPELSAGIEHLIYSKKPFDIKTGKRFYIDGVTPLVGVYREEYEKNFVSVLSDFAAEHDLPAVVMTLPNDPKSPLLKNLYRPLKDIYSSCDNVALYDCFDEYSNKFADKKHAANYQVNPADGHPGSASNKFFADYLCRYLKNDYSDVLGEKNDNTKVQSGVRINDCTPSKVSCELLSSENGVYEYSVMYPSANRKYDNYGIEFDKYFLTYPLDEDYIKLCFDVPVKLRDVFVSGETLKGCSLYYTCINEKLGYDDHSVYPFEKNGDLLTCPRDVRITSLCIHADTDNNDGGMIKLMIMEAAQ